MDISKIRQKIKLLSNEEKLLEDQLLLVREKMIRGAIVYQYRKCQKGNCKCTKGEPHGPFPYLSVIVKGKSIHKYIGKKEDEKLRKSLMRYKDFHKKLSRINAIQKELIKLWQSYRKKRPSIMRTFIQLFLVALLGMAGPRWLGLVDAQSTITTATMWAVIFAAVGGPIIYVMLRLVFKD